MTKWQWDRLLECMAKAQRAAPLAARCPAPVLRIDATRVSLNECLNRRPPGSLGRDERSGVVKH
jgi:hypothetical protein